MGDTTGIAWCKSTENFWVGCQRVSEACTACYAETLVTNRMGYSGLPGKKPKLWGPSADRHRTSAANWKNPFKWEREAAASGEFWPVFASSLSDIFEDRRDLDPWRADAFEVMEATPHLTWLLLTKRPEKIMELAPARWRHGFPWNVWQGTTVESTRWWDERVPHLLRVPAVVRFLSIEPQIEAIDYRAPLRLRQMESLRWLITGGESGAKPRFYDTEWAAQMISACYESGSAPFVKQMGEAWARKVHAISRHGADPSEWPEQLRVQRFPWDLTTARLAAKQGSLPIVEG